MFLKKKTFKNITVLYQFCRYIDDVADKNSKNKRFKLKDIKNKLTSSSEGNKLFNIKKLISKNIINKNHLLLLIDGVNSDISKTVRIKNNKELVSYAFAVAGTVGLMMSDILNIKERIAQKYAIDLGIAFQLTNIARDIIEDAKMNRIYIPFSWYKLNINEIKKLNKNSLEKLRNSTKDLLQLAEIYYQSAFKGLAFLSLRNRFAILLALLVYRQIGIKIINNNFSNLHSREKVFFFEKILCLFKCIPLFLFNFKIHKKNYNHNTSLHIHIKTLLIKTNKSETKTI